MSPPNNNPRDSAYVFPTLCSRSSTAIRTRPSPSLSLQASAVQHFLRASSMIQAQDQNRHHQATGVTIGRGERILRRGFHEEAVTRNTMSVSAMAAARAREKLSKLRSTLQEALSILDEDEASFSKIL